MLLRHVYLQDCMKNAGGAELDSGGRTYLLTYVDNEWNMEHVACTL